MYLVGDEGTNTLYHLRYRSLYAAERGRHGEGSNRTGRSGEDLLIPVPLGTLIADADSGSKIGEILEDGEKILVAAGGRGGRGNARFASPTRQAPRRADPGEEGENLSLSLELRLIADVGLVGLPNAGKSTLISVISNARPKIADYPFTTLVPNLGVVAEDRMVLPFVVADVPGLIAGAAKGAGLGTRFLRHIERCRVLVHLVDLSGESDDPARDLEVIEQELAAFDSGLLDRKRLVVGSKLDAAVEDRVPKLKAAAAARGLPVKMISAVTGEGVQDLIREIRQLLLEERIA